MVKKADTADVQQLIADGAQLVEVLPASHFDAEHLPGAYSIPLRKLNPRTAAALDRDRPVVTYCWDFQCDLSSRAAARFEALGFGDVYDYEPSKAAWMGLGLPVEGTTPPEIRAAAIARELPRCAPDARVADVTAELDRDGSCVVTTDDGVVLGIIDRAKLDAPPDTPVIDVAAAAPPTIRPYVSAPDLVEIMDRDKRSYVLVTLLDGTFVGRIDRTDLDQPGLRSAEA